MRTAIAENELPCALERGNVPMEFVHELTHGAVAICFPGGRPWLHQGIASFLPRWGSTSCGSPETPAPRLVEAENP